MSNWKREKLGNVVRCWIKGATPARSHKEYFAKKPGIPWVRVGDLKGRYLTEAEVYLTASGARETHGQVPKGAVLLSVSGTIGKTAIAGTDLTINQAIQAMVFDEGQVLPEYAYYYFQFFCPWLEAKSNTVTIPNLTKRQLEETYILFPCLEEQGYLTDVMKRAEDLQGKQENAFQAIRQAFFGALWRKISNSSYKIKKSKLKDYLVEPILAGSAFRQDYRGQNYTLIHALPESEWTFRMLEGHREVRLDGSRSEQYTLNKGDLLVGGTKAGTSFQCLLVEEGREGVVWGSGILRIRVQERRLRPEFLLAWMRLCAEYGIYDFFRGRTAVDVNGLNRFPIPIVEPEVQDKFVLIVRRITKLQYQLEEIKAKNARFYQSMLAAAFCGSLSKNYRTRHSLEEPALSLLKQNYFARSIEPYAAEGAVSINWEKAFGEEKRKMIEQLSEFQKEILGGFLGSETPMPIHVVHKKLKKSGKSFGRSYSVQDAIATVKILEGLGLLEKTPPEKLYLDETELKDPAGKPITIQNYQAFDGD